MNMGAKGAVSYSVDPATRSMKIEASRMTMGEYATLLTTFSQATGGGQEVKDMTGLTGYYQVAINFSQADFMKVAQAKGMDVPDLPAGPGGAAMPANAASDPGNTLVQSVQAMGLKLESRKVPVEQLVVDYIEKTPTEN
jgi:uncharacterized protein (TIGR03435 family)